MNCYYATVVDCLKAAPRKNSTRQLQLISQIVHVFQHCRALTVNLQKILYNSQLHQRQLVTVTGNIQLYYKINYIIKKIYIFLPTILNYLNDRERGRQYLLWDFSDAPPPNAPLPRRQYILIYLDDRERGGAPLSFVGFWRPAMPPLPRRHNTYLS